MSWLDSILVPVNREGYPFIAFGAVTALVLFFVYDPLGWAGVVVTLGLVFYFRDPDRITPVREGLIVSPADGVVREVNRAVAPEELGLEDDPRPCITIALDALAVRVNRVPASGTVTTVADGAGRFEREAGETYASRAVRLRTTGGRDIAFVQVAGRFARHIACRLEEGQEVEAGERFGMIRFGSRLEVYLDEDMAPLVAVGQRTIAGETVLADESATEPQRLGDIR